MLAPFDPTSPEHSLDPYSLYRRYRESEPVHRGLGGQWFLFRYAEVSAGLKDQRLLHANPQATGAPPPLRLFRLAPYFLNSIDPPLHTRLRALVARAFTPQVVEGMRSFVAHRCQELLEGLGPEFDVLEDYAGPLALSVVAHMLGCPVVDYPRFQPWSLALARLVEESTPAVVGAASQACDQLGAFLDERIAQCRRQPGEDLLSHLLSVPELGEDERVATCMLLLVAGHETTVHLLGNAVLALVEHPEEQARLRGTPGFPSEWGDGRGANDPGFLQGAVEEFLRYDAPGRLAVRYAAEDLWIEGCLIERGARLGLMVGSANRDPAVFSEPDRLNFERQGARHLGFGMGPHYCLGAGLARLEVEEALRALLGRGWLTGLDEPSWQRRPAFRALERLRVSCHPG